jgi:penicillin amidase
VPHVHAADEEDLYRGLGYCHGWDRSLAILLLRILAQGRACELLGNDAEMLEIDRFFRRMNFVGDAPAEVEKLTDADRTLAEAYCEGLNTALGGRAPLELRLLGVRPEPWSVADSALLSRLVGYVSLAQSQAEMERLFVEMLQAGVPSDHLEELFQGLLTDLDTELVRRVRLQERLVPEVIRWSPLLPRLTASNNWAVAPGRSRNGHSLLAGDPHLEVTRLPAVLHEVVLEMPDRYCIAGTIPGMPALIIGRTNDLAWAPTYGYMDAIDSWIEECRDGCYRRHVDGGDEWIPFRRRKEVIRRKKAEPLELVFYENDHGVLDGDPHEEGLYLTSRWSVASGTGAESFGGMFGVVRAQDVETGMRELRRVETAWNFVLADRHGNIGYQMSGRMPKRGSDFSSFVPLPGWDPRYDWQGTVPAEDLPRSLNPVCGFVASANDDLNQDEELRPINLPTSPYRAERIRQLLSERSDWSAEDFERMQGDVLSLQAQRFMEVLRPLLGDMTQADRLRSWDCHYDLDSRGAVLFERFYRELLLETFGGVCGKEVIRYVIGETEIPTNFFYNFDRVLLNPDSVWFGDEGRAAVFRRVAERVLSNDEAPRLAEERGFKMSHMLLGGRLPGWAGFDHGPVRIPGSRATLHQCTVFRSGGREQTLGPCFRLVTDLGEPAARTSLAGGLSDRRFSRWYTRGIADWAAGRHKTLRPSAPATKDPPPQV